MQKMTITLDDSVYEGLYKTIGKGRISQFIENLVRPYVLENNTEESYKAMAADEEREKDAKAWLRWAG
jgi:hypothetical protein